MRYAVSDADATSITTKTFQASYTTATRRLTYTVFCRIWFYL